MDTKPKVTIFIALYNNQKYVGKTIESILSQTYTNFEILVIDDGSTDSSAEVVSSFNNPKIRLLHNQKNMGLVYTRNRGLKEFNTDYIAILDSDDIFYPTKLQKQIEFLEKHPDFALVGTWTEVIDPEGKKTGTAWKNNISPEKISLTLLFHNCFSHSSTVIRKAALQGKKYNSPDKDEDYDLWIQLRKDWKLWNIPEILTQYRIHSTNISKTSKNKTYVFGEILKELKKLNIDIEPEEIGVHRTNYIYEKPDVKDFIIKRQNWLSKLAQANYETRHFPTQTWNEVLGERWLDSCSSNAYVGFWIWNIFFKSELSRGVILQHPVKICKFFIKCLIKKK